MIVHEVEPRTEAQSPQEQDDQPAQFEQDVARRTRGRIYGLHVDFADGQIVLTGRCHTYHDKQLAQQAALDLADLSTRVVNEIVVG